MEDEFALFNKENKSMGIMSPGDEVGKNKDLLNIKCFRYHEFGQYATKCPQKKASKKESAVAAIGEALASQFELDFTLIVADSTLCHLHCYQLCFVLPII